MSPRKQYGVYRYSNQYLISERHPPYHNFLVDISANQITLASATPSIAAQAFLEDLILLKAFLTTNGYRSLEDLIHQIDKTLIEESENAR